MTKKTPLAYYYRTSLVRIYHADSMDVTKRRRKSSVNLVMTSPPFALFNIERDIPHHCLKERYS